MTAQETATSKAPVEVRPYRDADEAEVLALLDLCLAGGPAGRRTAEFFRWKHHDNPFGRSPAFVAVDATSGAIVGLRTWLRWRLRHRDGGDLAAIRAVDTATHPDHQGRGIFRRLTTESLDSLTGDVDLVFNTPNEASGPGYLRMGWQAVGKVDLAVAPRRPLRMLAHRGDLGSGGVRGGAPPCPLPDAAEVLDDPRLGALVGEAAAPGSGLHTARSSEFLRWRYAPPGLAYKAAVVEVGGDLTGVALCRPRHRGALDELILADVLVRRGDTAAFAATVSQVRRAAGDYAVALPTRPHRRRTPGARHGWIRIPKAGPLLTTRPLHPLDVDPAQIGAWSLCLGDLEVF